MIVSHKHHFIFLKTRKTAGTSIELALRRIIGPEDIVTRLDRRDTRFVDDYAIPSAQNDLAFPRDIALRESINAVPGMWHKVRTGKQRPGIPLFNPYRQHLDARKIRYKVGEACWREYLKFTIERNPWDRTVSYYHWIFRNDANPPSFQEFVLAGRNYPTQTNYEIYSIAGIPVADFWIRYEHINEDLDWLSEQLDLPISLSQTARQSWAKADSRARPHWREYYDDETRRIVGLQFASEIALMGYRFED